MKMMRGVLILSWHALAAIQDIRYYSLSLSYARTLRALAPDLHSNFDASLTQQAIEWCQIALVHMRVQPGSQNYGRLTPDEIDTWKDYGCTQHFCRSESSSASMSSTTVVHQMGRLLPHIGWQSNASIDVRWGTGRDKREEKHCEATLYSRALYTIVTSQFQLYTERKECGPGPTLSVLTSMPPVTSGGKMRAAYYEILLALGENARTENLQEIVVMIDYHGDMDDEKATRTLRNAISAAQKRHHTRKGYPPFDTTSENDLTKIKGFVLGYQPSYYDMFKYANANLTGRLVAIANADVVLRNLNRLDIDAFTTSRPPLVAVLPVQAPRGAFGRSCKAKIENRCSKWRFAGTSWDVHILHFPLQLKDNPNYDAILRPRPVYPNQNGAENCAGVFFAQNGYEIQNLCLDILAEHWHCLGVNRTSRIGLGARVDKAVRFRPGWKVETFSPSGRGIRASCQEDEKQL